tara:strand:- start:662 stop:916 length:255 start_codon:yes stop_codon:yes gene_type:complete
MTVVNPKRPRGRPPKKKTLEQEAQEFYLNKDNKVFPPGQVQLGDYFAGCALSGLLASGKFLRSDEIVDEAFRYRDLMLEANKTK